MEKEIPEKKLISFTVNVICGEGTERKLPSPARFLELNGVTDPTDIELITHHTLKGQREEILNILLKQYDKSVEEATFIAKAYSDILYKFVMLSTNYNY